MTDPIKFRAKITGERRTTTRSADSKSTLVEEVEALIEIEINRDALLKDLGRAAIRNKGRRAAVGSCRAKIISEAILSSRASEWP